MPTKSNWLDKGLLLCIEWVLFLTISQFVSKWGGSIGHMIWTLLALGVLLSTGVFLLKYKYNRNRMGVYYLLTFGMVLVTWLAFSWPIIISFGLVLYVLWRLFSFIEGQSVRVRWWLWIATVCIILVLWMTYQPGGRHRELIVLLIFQTLLIAGYEGVLEWRVSKRLVGAMIALIGFLGVAICGVVIQLVFPYIKSLVYLVLDGVLYVLSFVFAGIWALVTHFLHPGSDAHKKALNSLLNNYNRHKPQGTEQIPVGHGTHAELMLIPIVIALLIISFFVIRSFRFSENVANETHLNEQRTVASTGRTITRPRFFERLRAPKDPVRAAVFQLQKKTRKTDLGRQKHETLSEWLGRLSVHNASRDIIQTVYDRVRYGHEDSISGHQARSFEEAIGSVEEALKKDK